MSRHNLPRLEASPEEVEASLECRYLTVPRGSLPEDFEYEPAGMLARLNSDYRMMINEVDPQAVSQHHDWMVRVELDRAAAAPLSPSVEQNGRWVEFHCNVQSVGHPFPKAFSLAWACSNCGNVSLTGPDTTKPPACTCESGDMRPDQSLSQFVDTQRVVLVEDGRVPAGRPLRVLECMLTGTLVGELRAGEGFVVGGELRITPTNKGHDFLLLVNNVMTRLGGRR